MKLCHASTPPEAHILCEMLKTHGIDAEVRGEGLFGLQGELPFGSDSEPYIWLHKPEQFKQANGLIELHRKSHENPGQPWRCPECQEEIEAQFAVCWKCGKSL